MWTIEDIEHAYLHVFPTRDTWRLTFDDKVYTDHGREEDRSANRDGEEMPYTEHEGIRHKTTSKSKVAGYESDMSGLSSTTALLTENKARSYLHATRIDRADRWIVEHLNIE